MKKNLTVDTLSSEALFHLALTNLEAITTIDGKPRNIYKAYKEYLLEEGKEALLILSQKSMPYHLHIINTLQEKYTIETKKINGIIN
jgi:hypothetical protein